MVNNIPHKYGARYRNNVAYINKVTLGFTGNPASRTLLGL